MRPSLLAAVLLVLLSSATCSTSYNCPRGCTCNETTVTCTSTSGLRSLDKALPVQRLVLSGVGLTKIPAQLENIRNVTELDLSGNQLSEVNHLGKRIRRLDLSRNRITSGKLSKIPPFVESLNLTHNEITYLPLHLMKLKKLRSIELANNPINCTCETLHIRNWLTTRHVWSDEHIKCSAPQEFKGRPWLQVKQADVCGGSTGGRAGGYNWDDYEDENDLMLGDQAQFDDGDEEEDEFKKDYMPVGEKRKRRDPPINIQNDEDLDGGSGDDTVPVDIGAAARVIEAGAGDGEDQNGSVRVGQIQNTVAGAEDEDEGSGSGGGILVSLDSSISISDGADNEESEEKPLTSPTGGLGIFGVGIEDQTTAGVSTEKTETTGAAGSRMVVASDATIGTESAPANETLAEEETVRQKAETKSTYILLAIIGVILLALIILVICRRRPDSGNRRNNKSDLESAREMQDMDKSLLGKPVEKNGHNPPERVPLMNNRQKSDYDKVFDKPPTKPERTSLEKPSTNSFKPAPTDRSSLYENVPQNNNNNNTVPHHNGTGTVPVRNGEPVGVHQPNHVPSQDDEVFLPAANGNPNQLYPDPNPESVESPKSKRYSPIYVPTSPKSDRYSPVYSPETGRVKIKMTETPKPKTPILVTRSRSRAGEYITTPDQKF